MRARDHARARACQDVPPLPSVSLKKMSRSGLASRDVDSGPNLGARAGWEGQERGQSIRRLADT